ncbi:MAG: LysR family transcriptional regulator [Actinomycetota bacterium]
MLTLHQLQVFVVVADEMSVSRAAERLVVSQPAVSATMAALRREIGVDLIERDGRGIALTDAGRTMYKYAQTMVGLLDEAVEETRAVAFDDVRPIRIATSSSLVSAVVAPILGRLREERSDLAFSMLVGNRNEVWRMLAAHETDIALTSKPPSTSDFETLATMPNSCVVVARPGSTFPGRLGQSTWLVREQGAALRSFADEIVAGLALDPDLVEIGSDDALLGAIEAGLGVGVLPRSAVDASLRERRLVIVPTDVTPLERPWHLVVRGHDGADQRIVAFAADMVLADPRFQLTTSRS